MSGGAAGAAAASAARKAREREEEEYLTMYSHEDLNQDWEFKIVRSTFGAFRNPEKLRQLVMEEAQAGWILVEKFDDSRVRFKRLRSTANNNPVSGIDPYRTNFGMSEGMLALAIFGVMAFFFALVFLIINLL